MDNRAVRAGYEPATRNELLRVRHLSEWHDMLAIFQVARGQLVRRVGECRQAQRAAAQNLVRVTRQGSVGELSDAG